jgi:hypothetical protein
MFVVGTSRSDQVEQDATEAKMQREADAWAVAMADLLWNDAGVRARMSAQFQRVVDQMVIARFGAASTARA